MPGYRQARRCARSSACAARGRGASSSAQEATRAWGRGRGCCRSRLPQLPARLEAQLRHEQRAAVPVAGERVRLSAAAVERGHQHAPRGARATDARPTRLLEVGGDLVVAPEPEVGVEAALEAGEPELVQPRRLVTRERRALRGRRSPLRARGREPAENRASASRTFPSASARWPSTKSRCELRRVELDVLDAQRVAGLLGDEPARRQDAAELRDVEVQHAPGRPRRSAAPTRSRSASPSSPSSRAAGRAPAAARAAGGPSLTGMPSSRSLEGPEQPQRPAVQAGELREAARPAWFGPRRPAQPHPAFPIARSRPNACPGGLEPPTRGSPSAALPLSYGCSSGA